MASFTSYFLFAFIICLAVIAELASSIPLSTGVNATVDAVDEVVGADACTGITCPDDKMCVVDVAASEGYKCCRNGKCSVRCKDPGEVPYSTRIPVPRKFRPKEKVVYSCISGYYMNSAMTGTIFCTVNGTWTKPMPTCKKIVYKPSPESTSPSQKQDTDPAKIPRGQKTDAVLIVIIVLIVILVAAIAFLIIRYKFQTGNFLPACRREPPNGIVLENTAIPDMPCDLDKNAIPISEFSHYVALGHNNTDQKFCEEFEDIQNHAISGLTWESSLMAENRDKNRYINIVAYDHSRARLQLTRRRQHSGLHRSSDYINANYVSSFEKPKAYIASQGPMPNTFNDFWRMIWENNVSVIVMITNLVENGRRKCDQYWPHEGREQYKHISVTLKDTDVYANYTVRMFMIRNMKQNRRHSRSGERRVLQFHYTQWPDHGTPEYILPVLTFIRRSSLANPVDTGPMVVHCSAGVGRTGAYIMLHSMIQMARTTGKVNINGFLRFIRTQRNYLVQTEDQYIFVHDALLSHFTCGDTECPARQLEMYVQRLTSLPASRNGTNTTSANGAGDAPADVNGLSIKEGTDLKHSIEEKTGLEKQFMNMAHYIDRDIDYDFALRAVNQGKNRPDGIFPIFRSRVPLHYRVGKEGSDYINASFIQGYRNSKMFIITQLPMNNTRNDFWQLVWDHNCPIIITIRDEDFSNPYWPMQDQQINCTTFNVSFGSESLLSLGQEGPTSLTLRDFILEATKDDYVLAVKQLDISHWPTIDELTPQFTQLMATLVRYTEGKEGSTVIQDRYGGTSAAQLACIHSLHQQLANENTVDVFQLAKVAYQMRPRVFTSHSHLHFLYKAMLLETNPSLSRKTPPKNPAGKSMTAGKSSLVTKTDELGIKNNEKSQQKTPAIIEQVSSVTDVKTENHSSKQDLENVDRQNDVSGDNLDESAMSSVSEDRPLLRGSQPVGKSLKTDKDSSINEEECALASPVSSTSGKSDLVDQSVITESTLLLEE